MKVFLYILLLTGSCLVAFLAGAVMRRKIIILSRIVRFLCCYRQLIKKTATDTHSSEGEAWYKHEPLIWAHAGGGIPVLYGNSRENFDCAIKQGFKCLEADVGLTADNVPVMTHLFRPNFENLYPCTPTAKNFLEIRIDDKYTPLTLSQFISLYKNYDGWIFLDGLSFGVNSRFDFRKFFSSVDESFRRKIIVQVFQFNDLLSLKHNNPFGGIHFSGIFGVGTNRYIRPLLIKALKSCGVKSVSISDFEMCGADVSEAVAEFRKNDIVVSVAGVNTISQYKRLRGIGVNCIDSDYLTPADIKGLR